MVRKFTYQGVKYKDTEELLKLADNISTYMPNLRDVAKFIDKEIIKHERMDRWVPASEIY